MSIKEKRRLLPAFHFIRVARLAGLRPAKVCFANKSYFMSASLCLRQTARHGRFVQVSQKKEKTQAFACVFFYPSGET